MSQLYLLFNEQSLMMIIIGSKIRNVSQRTANKIKRQSKRNKKWRAIYENKFKWT